MFIEIDFGIIQFDHEEYQLSIVCVADSDIVVKDDSIGRDRRRPAHHCTATVWLRDI